MDQTIHFKWTNVKTKKGLEGEANFFGNTGKDIATKMADFMQAMGLEAPPPGVTVEDDGFSELGWPKEEEEAKPQKTDNSDFHDAALAFMGTCEVHKRKWFVNRKDDQEWHSHKTQDPGPTVNENGYCNYYKVASQAWQELLREHDMGETQTREFLAKHFTGAPFEKQSEMVQALAIARLRVGAV